MGPEHRPHAIEAFFLPAGDGQRFCVLRVPPRAVSVRGCILFVQAFAEEMNKSRRAVAQAAAAYASVGFAVLQVDLLGCGDSSGEFAEATWSAWVDDVVHAASWLRARYPGPFWLWGLRTGALLAAAAMPGLGAGHHVLLWQPVTSGKVYVNQFLRTRLAKDLVDSASERTGTRALRERIAAGEALEIAGYTLAPSLVTALDAAELDFAPESAAHVAWLEVSSQSPPEVSPAARRVIERLSGRGVEVVAQSVSGPAFWQTQEIAEAPELVRASCAALLDAPGREADAAPASLRA